MHSRITTISQLVDHLCAESARLHKAISAMPSRYADIERLALTNQLVGVRTILADIHGAPADPTVPSSDPGEPVLRGWWEQHQPGDWEGEQATCRRHGEQLYYVTHRLLRHSRCVTTQQLAQHAGMPQSSAYLAMADPARCHWSTLAPLVTALGGDEGELWAMWKIAYRENRGTKPKAKPGAIDSPAAEPDQDQG